MLTFGASHSQVVLEVKNLPASAGDIRNRDSVPGLGRFHGGGHGNPLQYSFLENSHGQRSLMSYSPWGHRTTVHGVVESWTTEQLTLEVRKSIRLSCLASLHHS